MSALEYLYGQGLEHNNIKPANILFSEERGAVLCDFSLLRQLNLSKLETLIYSGTAFYIPPEYIIINH